MGIVLKNNYYLIGIGGIGVSAVASILLQFQKNVAGSDLEKTEITNDLIKRGAKVKIGKHKATNIPSDIECVIYSNAIEKSNPEYKKAKARKIPIYSYPEFLAELMKNYIPIIVSGTHGKSTVTGLLAQIFIAANYDPTIVVGTKLPLINGNGHLGLGRHFIAEGDEYCEAFLNYQPIGLVINNIEADHLDYYKNIANIKKAFTKLAKSVPRGGFIIANADDDNVMEVIKNVKCRVITFGFNQGDFQVTQVVRSGELTRFAVRGLDKFDISLRLPGDHNIANALAATVLSIAFGIEIKVIQKALLKYAGAWRRFEIKGRFKKAIVIDDYAHHPTEIKATLKTARQLFGKQKIWCIFQPHSRHRTKALLKDFSESFNDCDRLILTDIFKVTGREGRERIKISHLADAINKKKKEVVTMSQKKIISHLKKYVKASDIVIFMGAGDINKLTDILVKNK